ncbi:DUF397 domain-containing protein [Streptomyces griseus]|uniref:DUF397 domain-containing protein n=1 Tax=Streptomyces griseus TaxID=1911 RepID=UPI00099C3DC1|nr:DUF397 domain-containing protein [Streptomyces griseus]
MSGTALRWFKSSYSGDEGGNCLEMAAQPRAIHLRDSKNPALGYLTIAPSTWTSFLRSQVSGGTAEPK